MASSQAASIFTCWTKFKGGKFQMTEDGSWKEYDAENKEVGTFQRLNNDDYDLNPYEVVLLDTDSCTLIKLDKSHSRKTTIVMDEDFDLELLELFRLKWTILEQGFWDTLAEQ